MTSSARRSLRATWSPAGACPIGWVRKPTAKSPGEVFLGRSVTQHKQVSDVTAHVIDEEVRRVIDSNYQRAYKIIQTNMDKLQAMSEALIKYETIDEEQIKDIMEGRVPRPPRDWDDTPTPTPRGPHGREAHRSARQSGGAALALGTAGLALSRPRRPVGRDHAVAVPT